ncbi:YidC/Oxa1 family membrane protein insertase [Microbacterium sp. ZKA21]|jgi:YidC/Oxa1 family membrane protein insertase|uniref:YidC/Oxa1 family membrane protein insertase n=1 Tax=Microbacterium sp. ZKA21 TaxID=3381694 RepID=UPI003D2576FB
MDIFAFPPLAALLDAAYGALAGLATFFEPAAGAAALAVVVVTLIIRTLLIPVGISQARAEQTRARLAPRLRALQKRHGKNPERLQLETLQLYRDENTSPFAGFLPVLLQAPVVGLLYTLFLRAEIAGHPNDLLAHDLFGAPLGTSLVHMLTAGPFSLQTFAVFGGLLAIMAVTTEITRRVFRPTPVDDSPMSSPGMLRMMSALHYATVVFALFVPLAAALYLTVTVIWTLIQRIILRRRYPLPV